jgi:zinc protease
MTTFAQRGLSPTRRVLPNGAVVSVKESSTTPAVTISAAVRAGSIYDPPERLGLATLVSRVIDRGTAGRTADQLADELDNRGVSLHVAVTRHLMILTCTCLGEDFEIIFDLLADIMRRPIFPEEEVVRRRGEIITALRQDEDNPAVRAGDGLLELLYPHHPYGRRPKGTMESIESIERQDLVEFHAARFAPAALSVVIVGDVPGSRALMAAEIGFGDWQAAALPGADVPAIDPPAARQQLVLPMPNKAQVDVAYGFVAVRRSDPSYYACSVMNNILGQYGLGGRLADSIRDRQGMAYYAFSTLEANLYPGPLVIRAGISPSNVDRTVASIDEEVARMAADGVTEQELQDTRRYLVGSIPRMLETNAGIAAFLQMTEHFGLGSDYDQRLPDLLAAVTRADVHDAARRLLHPDRASVVIAGPCEPAAER